MDINDFFGPNANRPDHPDFWRLSETILGYDAGIDMAVDKDKFWEDAVDAVVDRNSVMYMAFQRAARAYNCETVGDVVQHVGEITKATVLYIEGFLMGAEFQRKDGKQ